MCTLCFGHVSRNYCVVIANSLSKQNIIDSIRHEAFSQKVYSEHFDTASL